MITERMVEAACRVDCLARSQSPDKPTLIYTGRVVPFWETKKVDIRAILEAADAAAWEPIETAPRDGTDVLVFRPTCKPNEYIPQIGTDYWKAARGTWMRSTQQNPPTHWRPLPAPPKDV